MDTRKIEKLVDYDLLRCKTEEDVKINFIVPFFEALGHDRFDFEHKNMDILIKHPDSKYSVLVEAKHHLKNLSGYVDQLKRYWDEKRTLLAVLCNGIELWIFHPTWAERPFHKTRLFVIKKKEMLSPENIDVFRKLLSHEALMSGLAKESLVEFEKQHENEEFIDLPDDNFPASQDGIREPLPILNDIDGVNQIINRWKSFGYNIRYGNENSLQFTYTKGRTAFRIEKSPPRIVIYSGANDPRRGSPLIKGASEADKKKLKDYGFSSNTPDWKRDLTEKDSLESYVAFIDYAINACKG